MSDYDFISSIEDLEKYINENPNREFFIPLGVQISKSEDAGYDDLRIFFVEEHPTPDESEDKVIESLWFDVDTKQRVDEPEWAKKRRKKVDSYAQDLAESVDEIDEDQFKSDLEYRRKIKRVAQQTLIENGQLSKNPRE